MTAEDCARLNEELADRWEREAEGFAKGDADERRFSRRCRAIADELNRAAKQMRERMAQERAA